MIIKFNINNFSFKESKCMSKRNKYLASLDIGSSKICCIIANRDNHDISKIIGIGYNEAKGISNGVISDFSMAIKVFYRLYLKQKSKLN